MELIVGGRIDDPATSTYCSADPTTMHQLPPITILICIS